MSLVGKRSLYQAYRMRLKRRALLWRSFKSRRQLQSIVDRTSSISRDAVIVVMTLRNEITRLPYFLDFYRNLGVSHFLIIDNDSDDGSSDLLAEQADVSLWRTDASYRAARFGLDWMTWLQIKFAHNRWCLMVDADELLVYDGDDKLDLVGLTRRLDGAGHQAFGALMLDLYPKAPLGQTKYATGQDPREVLEWFDSSPYRSTRQWPLGNLWVQGGARERVFFSGQHERSPTLNKIPLVKWNRKFAYVNSCHSMLPPKMNFSYEGPSGDLPSGVLLHTKFLPEIVSKSETEKQRRQHFHSPSEFDHYYEKITQSPTLWTENSVRYSGPKQLVEIGLMPPASWSTATRQS